MLHMSRDNVYMLAALLYRDILAYVDREHKGVNEHEVEQSKHPESDGEPRNSG